MGEAALDLAPLGHIIRDAAELTQRIDLWRAQGAHVLSPASTVTAFPPNYGVTVSTVYINTKEEATQYGPVASAGEIYRDRSVMAENERGLTRIGLQRLEQLAGMSWLPYSRRTDDRHILLYWEYESWAGLIGYDGQPRTVKGTAEVDYRDGSPQIASFTDKQLAQARRFGLRQCETKSQSAAVRNALGIKSKYTLAQLALPFIVLKVTYLPDAADPHVRQLIAERATAGIAALYPAQGDVVPFGRRSLGPATPNADDELTIPATATVEPVPVPAAAPRGVVGHREPVTRGQQSANAPGNEAPPDPPAARQVAAPPAATLPEGACFVESYRDADMKKRDGSGTFTKGWIVLSDGREATSVFYKHLNALKAAKDERRPVRVITKPNTYNGRTELVVDAVEDASAPQDVPLPMTPPAAAAPVKL